MKVPLSQYFLCLCCLHNYSRKSEQNKNTLRGYSYKAIHTLPKHDWSTNWHISLALSPLTKVYSSKVSLLKHWCKPAYTMLTWKYIAVPLSSPAVSANINCHVVYLINLWIWKCRIRRKKLQISWAINQIKLYWCCPNMMMIVMQGGQSCLDMTLNNWANCECNRKDKHLHSYTLTKTF